MILRLFCRRRYATNEAAPSSPIAAQPPKHEWPDTDPPDMTDPYWEFNNNMSVNGTPYRKVETSPGRWRWQVNQEAVEEKLRWEREVDDLRLAMRTRVVTDAEFNQAKALGLMLVVRAMQPYYEHEKRRELDDLFYQQARLRALVASPLNPLDTPAARTS